MRRGFKTEAKRLALELRAEIGLDAYSPFNPYAFADEYGIPVVRLSNLYGPARDHFLKADGSALSGALVPIGTGVAILENDAQPLTRKRTTMCHELAHVVLEYEFGVSLSVWAATRRTKPTGSPARCSFLTMAPSVSPERTRPTRRQLIYSTSASRSPAGV